MMTNSNSTLPAPLAIVAGVRTPFAKAFGALASVSADELGRQAVAGVLDRSGLKPNQVDEVIFGNVAGPAEAANVSRVIALRAGIPQDRIAHTVHRNCASGLEAIITAWQAILTGRSEVVVAGGTESMSNVPFLCDTHYKDFLVELGQQKTFWKRLKVLTKFRPKFLKPVPGLQLGLTDPTCGLNMGQTAELLAKDFSISRTQQDEFALTSHQRATAAWSRCFFKGETVPVTFGSGKTPLEKDVGPRANQTMEALARLKPLFDKEHGTVTAGNSCPLTDGAAALVLMTAERAKAEGHRPLGYLRDYAVAGCEPQRMGLGPVFAVDKLLKRRGLTLNDFELYEINEAFAAQVLACRSAFASPRFAVEHLGRDSALGDIPPDKLNVNGGAIALGHPVGTTGARLVITLLRALKEQGLRRGLASLCIGGGQGYAAWVETELD
jgi:acetyl-CoA C-acetyltransferase/acetyl-CoA acyltransferase